MAQDACPAAPHRLEVCGTLSWTDYMGVPGTVTKYWVSMDGKDVRIVNFTKDFTQILLPAIQNQSRCLYSDQESITDTIEVQEVCAYRDEADDLAN